MPELSYCGHQKIDPEFRFVRTTNTSLPNIKQWHYSVEKKIKKLNNLSFIETKVIEKNYRIFFSILILTLSDSFKIGLRNLQYMKITLLIKHNLL